MWRAVARNAREYADLRLFARERLGDRREEGGQLLKKVRLERAADAKHGQPKERTHSYSRQGVVH